MQEVQEIQSYLKVTFTYGGPMTMIQFLVVLGYTALSVKMVVMLRRRFHRTHW